MSVDETPMGVMTFPCQVCQSPLQADETQVGTLVRCPVCKTALLVPDPVAHQPRSPQAGPLNPPAAASTRATSYATPTRAVPSVSSAPAPPQNSPPLPRRVTVPASLLAGRVPGSPDKRYGFNCVYCSSRLEATEAVAAQEGVCPTCGNTITIPILDKYGRLIDPVTRQIIKQDPHPVHAYAAAGDRAPKIVRLTDGSQAIECPRCRSLSVVTANNCKSCGMPFTMEGTTLEAAGASNSFCVASLVLGIIGIPMFCAIVPPVLAIILGAIGYNQVTASGQEAAGKGMAIAGMVCGGIGTLLMLWAYLLS